MAGLVALSNGGACRRAGGGDAKEDQQHLSLLHLLVAALRKSMVACSVDGGDDVVAAVQKKMDIGCPTDVRHVAHVTFDPYNGFLGLPVEFEVQIPDKVPSASASVFGVSPESMQCCYDSRGNSVPTILLLLQERLYSQGGLKAEGIFRINPENGQEEYVRDKLNQGVVPDDIDVHCLAGLIKAWFRELPAGVLDSLSPEQVLRCSTEEEFVQLIHLLLPTQAALLGWAVELMADVVEEEEVNKMNARNIAMVFAPNMSQMSDPLTALMHAVQVMNLLKALILKTLRERQEEEEEEAWSFSSSSPLPSDAQLDHHPDSGELTIEQLELNDEIEASFHHGRFETDGDVNDDDDRDEEACSDDYSGRDETETTEEEESGDQATATVNCIMCVECGGMSEWKQGGRSSSLSSEGDVVCLPMKAEDYAGDVEVV